VIPKCVLNCTKTRLQTFLGRRIYKLINYTIDSQQPSKEKGAIIEIEATMCIWLLMQIITISFFFFAIRSFWPHLLHFLQAWLWEIGYAKTNSLRTIPLFLCFGPISYIYFFSFFQVGVAYMLQFLHNAKSYAGVDKFIVLQSVSSVNDKVLPSHKGVNDWMLNIAMVVFRVHFYRPNSIFHKVDRWI